MKPTPTISLESKIREMKKAAKDLADNLELFCGERKCPVCGAEPEKQAILFESELKESYYSGYKKGVKDEIKCVETSGEHLGLQKTLNELKGEGKHVRK
jgi:hypothetical protein